MMGLIEESAFFGVLVSFAAYGLECFFQKKTKLAILNPLLISVILVITVLIAANINYEVYYNGAKYISYLLTPATICLALPLYEKIELLKSHWKAVVIGIFSGVLSSLSSVLLLSRIFKFSHEEYVTFLPKSITTAIGMGLSEELGGYVNLTVAIIIITGITGNIIAPFLCKLFRISEPIAKGIAIGSSSHAIGTTRAMQMGEIEGAMSSLSIVVSGILTVVCVPLFAGII